MRNGNSLARAALFGAVTGLRSMLGAALMSRHLEQIGDGGQSGRAGTLLSRENLANFMTVLAVGELIADKLPAIPARTEPGPLLFRAVVGAVAGGAACSERHDNPAAGAIVGAAAAVATAFGAYYLRRWLTRELGVPDGVVAVGEDSLAFSVGKYAAGM